ncbi:MAG TPA: phosphotransferase [Streptosporangiaceae bacterium]|nr:phosphotransferase [Streptosporangiaceae bacterium]
MFRCEVRFYQEIAPLVGVRVPACYRAEATDDGTLLELEDLSSWRFGADPASAAEVLARLHERWPNEALSRWPWLRQPGAAVDLVAELYDQTWPLIAGRTELGSRARDVGDRLVGRVAAAESAASAAGPLVLTHGDASAQNMRTSPATEIALLDWEDVGIAPGVSDLAWLLVSSVEPDRWNEVIAAYGHAGYLGEVLPAVAVQGFLSMSDTAAGSAESEAWGTRLGSAAARIGA